MISGLVDSLFGESTQDKSGRLSPMFQQYGEQAQFRPYTVSTTRGSTSFDPTTGQTTAALSPEAVALQDLAGGGASSMFRSLQGFDPEARSRQIFAEQSELLQPAFEQQAQTLKNTLFGSGRGGLMLGGGAVGAGAGTGMVNPDVYNQSLAQNRALAELAAGSRTQALDEAASLAQTGGGLLSSALSLSDLENALIRLGVDAETARAASAYGAGNLALSPQLAEIKSARGPMDIANLAATGFGSYIGAGGTFGSGGGSTGFQNSLMTSGNPLTGTANFNPLIFAP